MKDVVSAIKTTHTIYVLVCFSVLALLFAEGESRSISRALQVLQKIQDLTDDGYNIKQAKVFRDVCVADFARLKLDSSRLRKLNGVILPADNYVLNTLNPHFTVNELAGYFSTDYHYYNFIARSTLHSLVVQELSGPDSPYGKNAAKQLRRIRFMDDERNPAGKEEIQVNDTASWAGIVTRYNYDQDTLKFYVYVDLVGASWQLLEVHAPPGSYDRTRDVEFKKALDSTFDMNFDVTAPTRLNGARLDQLMPYDKEIGDLELDDAMLYLSSKLDESRSRLGPVDLNLSLRWTMVFTPAILLILSLYMLVNLLQLRRIVTAVETPENLWFPFYNVRLAWVLAVTSLMVLPITTQALVLFQFVYYGFDLESLLLVLVIAGMIAQVYVAVRTLAAVQSIRS